MGNQGWTSGGGGGEAVSSTERATGVTTQCADGEPFLVGYGLFRQAAVLRVEGASTLGLNTVAGSH